MSSAESGVWQEAANQYAILLTLSQNPGCKMHIFAPQPQLFFLSLVMLPWKWPMNQTSQSCCQWKEINLHEPCLGILLQHPPGYRDTHGHLTPHTTHGTLEINQNKTDFVKLRLGSGSRSGSLRLSLALTLWLWLCDLSLELTLNLVCHHPPLTTHHSPVKRLVHAGFKNLAGLFD